MIGVLAPMPLTAELDSAALIGWPVAESTLDFDGYPTTVYVRTRDDAVADVRLLLAATANPEHPNEVRVSRPSDALAARRAADRTRLGTAVTVSYAAYQHWPTVVPLWASAGGVLVTAAIGGVAGLYPAWRAARLPPTEALAG